MGTIHTYRVVDYANQKGNNYHRSCKEQIARVMSFSIWYFDKFHLNSSPSRIILSRSSFSIQYSPNLRNQVLDDFYYSASRIMEAISFGVVAYIGVSGKLDHGRCAEY